MLPSFAVDTVVTGARAWTVPQREAAREALAAREAALARVQQVLQEEQERRRAAVKEREQMEGRAQQLQRCGIGFKQL